MGNLLGPTQLLLNFSISEVFRLWLIRLFRGEYGEVISFFVLFARVPNRSADYNTFEIPLSCLPIKRITCLCVTPGRKVLSLIDFELRWT